ncbi:hypothetical protein AALO_G00159630 [Alosa alosa]|uniref:Caldesmon 1b n=2 Tax=Alosa TaxID=34772 RepID=A0AAV6GK22_9TELE|nr:hypothetical protein AALO_G00159630 [Alosa alosa]
MQEEEERQRKQELADKKAKEEEEKRRLKEEIEKRRAEAAEKRQKGEAPEAEAKMPFKCVGTKGPASKIGVKAEFLNKSAQKSSSVRPTHNVSPIVTKIGNRMEQFTSAAQGSKEPRSPKSPLVDAPGEAGVRNIKSMWEKSNAQSSPTSPLPVQQNAVSKETSGMKTGVTGQLNSWKTKAPEPEKAAPAKPAQDPKRADVTKPRSLWENKSSTPGRVAFGKK